MFILTPMVRLVTASLRWHIIRTIASLVGVTASVLLVGAGTASAQVVYEARASVVSSEPPVGCGSIVYVDRVAAGRACFTQNGDRFWIRDLRADGLRVEMRAQVSPTGDGFRCYASRGSDVAWQRCDGFYDKIPEPGGIAYTVSLWEGDQQKYVGNLISTST